MLSLKTLPYLHRPHSPSKFLYSSLPISSRSTHRRPLAFSSSSAAAAKMNPVTTVEHVVLFKVRPLTDPSKIDAMVSNLRSLTSLDLTTHLTVVPFFRHRSAAASDAGFTHLLHGRYRSKPDLAAYSAHPAHMTVVKENVLPICEDVMAVDWLADVSGPAAPPPGSAMRLSLVKPKEGVTAAEVVAAIGGVEASAPVAGVQVSYGENFSPARAKGYGVGLLRVFPGLEELDGMDAGGEAEAHKEKVRQLLESIIAIDYVIPAPPAASL